MQRPGCGQASPAAAAAASQASASTHLRPDVEVVVQAPVDLAHRPRRVEQALQRQSEGAGARGRRRRRRRRRARGKKRPGSWRGDGQTEGRPLWHLLPHPHLIHPHHPPDPPPHHQTPIAHSPLPPLGSRPPHPPNPHPHSHTHLHQVVEDDGGAQRHTAAVNRPSDGLQWRPDKRGAGGGGWFRLSNRAAQVHACRRGRQAGVPTVPAVHQQPLPASPSLAVPSTPATPARRRCSGPKRVSSLPPPPPPLLREPTCTTCGLTSKMFGKT